MSPEATDAQRRPRSPRRAAALALCALCALVIGACGGGVPEGSVASVDGEEIEQPEFDHWLGAVAKAQGPTPGAPSGAVVPDPPSFARCTAARQGQAPPGGPRPDPRQLREQCRREYESLKQRVMQFLVNARWIQQEADDREVEVDEAVVRRNFQDQKRKAFPDDRQYRQFLAQSGQTEADILYRLRLDLLVDEVQKSIAAGRGNVTDEQVRDYYNRNRARFGQPERREVSLVLAKDEAGASRARKALDSGDSFAKVARRYSTDDATKGRGGRTTVSRGQQDRALDEAVFRARPGQVAGPVKSEFGSYVLRVEKIIPATQQTLPQASEMIRQQLRSQGEQKALNDFVKGFERRHREETVCAPGFLVSECSNGPPPPPQQAPGGAPGQGGAPQQGGGAPQQGSPPAQGPQR